MNDKDLKPSGASLNPPKIGSSNPTRGLEAHVDKFKNHGEASRVSTMQFARAGSGPEAGHGMDRGPFASRTKLTSNP